MGIKQIDVLPIRQHEPSTEPCPNCCGELRAAKDHDLIPSDGWIGVYCSNCKWSDAIGWMHFKPK